MIDSAVVTKLHARAAQDTAKTCASQVGGPLGSGCSARRHLFWMAREQAP